MSAEERLKELGIVLPPPNAPVAVYVPGVIAGSFLFTAGQTPRRDGKPAYTGKLGAELSVEEGKAAARLCALSCLAIIREMAGSLDRVERIVKVNGYVNAAPDFTGHPQVINGASELLEQVFGEAGKHARAATGCASLPGNAACEVEMIVQLKA